MPTEMSSSDLNDAIRRHAEGQSLRRIAADLGCSRFLLSAELVERGLRTKRSRPSLDTVEVVRRYIAGESMKALAREFGCSSGPVHRILVEAGVAIRGNVEAVIMSTREKSPEDRKRWAVAANAAVRGKAQTEEHRRKIAQTRERDVMGASPAEFVCADMLRERGYPCTLQKAIGRYNVDLALDEVPVAVEIFGGYWHTHARHATRFRKRFDHILDAGWFPVIVWTRGNCPVQIGAIDYIIALAERVNRGETVPRQEFMIRGNGKPSAVSQDHFK